MNEMNKRLHGLCIGDSRVPVDSVHGGLFQIDWEMVLVECAIHEVGLGAAGIRRA